MSTLAGTVAKHAAARPHEVAFVDDHGATTWRDYDERSDGLARALVDSGIAPKDRVAVLLPDGAAVHTCYLAIEKAGAVIVGIGPRAGDREIEHLLGKSGARLLLAGEDRTDLADRLDLSHRIVGDDELRHGVDPSSGTTIEGRAVGPDAFWMLNSTSGTTGMPKCVMHHQARWFAFHELAVGAGALRRADVFMSALPAPFGFGIWTAHVTPTLLGATCVLTERFDADACLERIERERVSVLAAVSTQLVMLVQAPSFATRDVSSLRVVFTGGEMVPYATVAELEERTGCAVLQFYGSNETGALSRTTLVDDRERRLRTAGRIIPSMKVRLLDEQGEVGSPDAVVRDVTAAGGPGVAVCRGPLTCLGYYDDPEANAALVTPDGWMRTGDVCTLDPDGYLRVVGRASDFIIRGGKNISAAQVEEELGNHPAIALAAAVAMPDPVFGERVCAFVELRDLGGDDVAPTLEDVRRHLETRGVGKELWPERLEVMATMPRASGGKIAKGELRAIVASWPDAGD